MKKVFSFLIFFLAMSSSFSQSSYWRDKVTGNKIHIYVEDGKCISEYENGLKVVLCSNSYYESTYHNQFRLFEIDKEFELLSVEKAEEKVQRAVPKSTSPSTIILGHYSLSRESKNVTFQNFHDLKIIAWSFTDPSNRQSKNCFDKVHKWMKTNSENNVEFTKEFAESLFDTKGMNCVVKEDEILFIQRGVK